VVKKKKSVKKSSNNFNRNLLIGVVIVILLFVFAYYAGGYDSEDGGKGLGQMFGGMFMNMFGGMGDENGNENGPDKMNLVREMGVPGEGCKNNDDCEEVTSEDGIDLKICMAVQRKPVIRGCVECDSNDHCEGYDGPAKCNRQTHRCDEVECLNSDDCQNPTPACDAATNMCIKAPGCDRNSECKITDRECNMATRTCIDECYEDRDCKEGDKRYCLEMGGDIKKCVSCEEKAEMMGEDSAICDDENCNINSPCEGEEICNPAIDRCVDGGCEHDGDCEINLGRCRKVDGENYCVECKSDKDCVGVCARSGLSPTYTCYGDCKSDYDCGGKTPSCNSLTNLCSESECETDEDCTGELNLPGLPHCTDSGTCVK
jgi:hypothetical protein